MKKSYKNIEWHLFADNIDEYYLTLKETIENWNLLKSKGCENIRIYKLTRPIDDNDSEPWDECYYKGIGEWPQ